MGTTINKTVTVREKNSGREFLLDETAEVATDIRITVTCDNAKCDLGVDGKPTIYTWTQNGDEDAGNIPDGAYRLLVLQLFTGKKYVFCCRGCLRDFMRSYVSLRSPREMSEEMKNNLAVAQGKKPEDIELVTDKEINDAITQKINEANGG